MMPRRLSGLTCLFFSTALLSVLAEETIDKTDFRGIQLHKSGELEAKFDPVFQLIRLYDGVHLTLVAETAENNLDIEAQAVDFRYDSEEDTTASVIVFSGAVRFTHSKGTIRAENATIHVETKEVLFTGNPTADLEQARGIKAESIHMNFETGRIHLRHPKIRELIWGVRDEDSDTAKPQDPG